MRFLIDQNRSPRLAGLLRDSGHDAVHTLEVGLEEAEDDELLLLAAEHQRVVVSGDTDFGALLALAHRRTPSVILFRARHLPRAEEPVPREVSLLLEFVRGYEQAWHDDDVELGERGEPLEGSCAAT